MSPETPPAGPTRFHTGLKRAAICAPVAGMLGMIMSLASDRPLWPHATGAALLLGGSAAFSAFTISLTEWLPPPEGAEVAGAERVRAAEAELEDSLRRGQGPQDESSAARLELADLWSVTHARLNHYHGIALAQAAKSFRNAQIASGLGFALLVVFMLIAVNASTTAGSIVSGGLGAVSAALSGYVSRTFVRSQEAAASHLRAYFDQPLEMSRFLAAERLIADSQISDTQRAEVVTALVQAMVAPPMPPPLQDPTRN